MSKPGMTIAQKTKTPAILRNEFVKLNTLSGAELWANKDLVTCFHEINTKTCKLHVSGAWFEVPYSANELREMLG